MIRPLLLWASTNPALAKRLPRYRFVRRAVRRFMPGEQPEDALAEAERQAEKGASSLVTLLGEHLSEEAEAHAVTEHYLGVLGQIRERGLDCEISVKPTQLGLDLDEDLALDNLRKLLAASTEGPEPLHVWIDMESSEYVDRTLELFKSVRRDHEHVGVCLQTYLRRTEKDIEDLLPLEPAIRLVKGAYLESPEIAFPKKASVDSVFQRSAKRLLREALNGRVGRTAIATHDPRIIHNVTRISMELELDRDLYEFQMLYGIGQGEQDHLLRQGYNLRVLISYGEAWFPWYMRRLAERPANVWFVLKQLVSR